MDIENEIKDLETIHILLDDKIHKIQEIMVKLEARLDKLYVEVYK